VFKIICCGWNCAEFIETTLKSIDEQTCQDFQVSIGYEGTDEGRTVISNWWLTHNQDKWKFSFHAEPHYLFDVRSRYEAVLATDPQDDDIIIFLDIDGDKFAHPQVLEHLLEYYSDDTLLTYGSYQPYPPSSTCSPAMAYPEDIIANRSYRAFGQIYFNHLRTMKGKVFKAIPEDQYKWAGMDRWYEKGCDVIFTLSGLELVGRRHKVIEETLMLYNSENPNSAWRVDPAGINSCTHDFMGRPPLPQMF
jgi:hypothetical protein